MSIKVLHINYSDIKGGAAIAVKRIHDAQKKIDIDSKIVVAEKYLDLKDIIGPKSTFEEVKWKVLNSINRKIGNLEKKERYDSNSYNLIPNNFVKKLNKINCDIINLHWIGSNLIPIKDLKKINKPLVWTLHDMWPYTGSEHYTKSFRFVEGYNKNNKPKEQRGYDIEKYCWSLKKKNYPKNLKIIATSNWQLNNAKKSFLLKDKKLFKIPLPIDFNFWRPMKKSIARNILNIPENKKLILIGSEKIDLERKGYNLIDSILNIVDNNNTLLIVFGRNSKKLEKINKFNKIYFEEISPNSQDLKILYSACDLFLAPSIQESFGQTVLEAASCCLPSICFENNGISEIIDHKVNGYIAKEGNVEDFAKGIDWCLQSLKQNDMEKNLKNLKEKFSSQVIAEEYKKLYKSII
tara:strand:- start:114 stop:1337 length:1224 start_codon:yes stop_codon:yes gene_type:complete